MDRIDEKRSTYLLEKLKPMGSMRLIFNYDKDKREPERQKEEAEREKESDR